MDAMATPRLSGHFAAGPSAAPVAAAQPAQAPAQPAQARAARQIDPLSDPRWEQLLAWHPDAGVFHTTAWLRALQACYGYEPVAYTSASPGEPLSDGLVFCRVRTWLTRERMVSVPFADHCQPLLACAPDDADASWRRLIAAAQSGRRGYLEIRPLRAPWGDANDQEWSPSSEYALHVAPISGDREAVLRGFHKDCVQRRIRRAEREQLDVEMGRSPALLDEFFALHALTRRRHGLPPQPRTWFRHLAEAFGEGLTVCVARKQERAIAAIVTLQFRERLTYKYGASDAAWHALGAMPLLMWRAIEEGRRRGARTLELGRSATDNTGLLAFKQHWNAQQQQLTYFRFPCSGAGAHRAGWRRVARKPALALASHLPQPLLIAAGELLYRHIA
jgi:hypothetical protein